MTCKFNVNDLENSISNFGDDLYSRIPDLASSGLDNDYLKLEILREIREISEAHLIDSSCVDVAFTAFDDDSILGDFDEKALPNEEEIKNAMIAWTVTPEVPKEDTSTSRLDNQEKNILRVNDDPLALAYGRALKARIRALQHANSVGVHSILYTDEGIINNTQELNHAIEMLQEELLKNVLDYLNNNIIGFKYPDSKMYLNGLYTGIVEKINSEYGQYFKFDFNQLNDFYNKNNLETLDAYSSWIILQNYDTLLKLTFGKALNIDGNKSKYNIGKYSIAGGSNVYTTWRVSEEIDLSKEINNISQSIITSLPYYVADSSIPTTKNLKFNEFVYLISKLKEMPLHTKGDFSLSDENFLDLLLEFSPKTLEIFKGKSFFSVINTLRENPQKYLPAIMEVMNNKEFFEVLQKNYLDNKYFASIDRDLINTIYQGLFSELNPKSLLNIQRLKEGFLGTNYFSFVTLTIDSMYKSNFLQYFRNADGDIYVRNMYDLSLYAIEQTIKLSINRFNSTIIAANYKALKNKYNTSDDLDGKDFDILSLDLGIKPLNLDGKEYILFVGENLGQRNYRIYDGDTKADITDPIILDKLKGLIKSLYAKPSVVTYLIQDFHRGPLTVEMNLKNGKIQYLLNGESISFHGEEDYNSLSKIILDTLQLNFDINPDYFEAYLNRLGLDNIDKYGFALDNLMLLVTRVIANQYIQENYIKNTPAYSKKSRVAEIYDGDYKTTYNSQLKELNFLGDSETSIIRDLAEANALVTGRLTSSLILDGEGNALASSTLSRLLNSLNYQIETQGKTLDSSVKHFILWNPGVYKGVSLLKEFKDNSTKSSKNHTQFSNKEIENALVFVDFLSGIVNEKSTKTPLTDGIVGFYPSENSDKTYVGRLLIDLKHILVGDTTLYNLLKENPSNISKFYPIIKEQLGTFYNKVLENINKDWRRVLDLVDAEILAYNTKILNRELNGSVIVRNGDLSYGNWSAITDLKNLINLNLDKELTELDVLRNIITKHNNQHPNDIITLRDLIHYVASKSGELQVNNSFIANLERFSSDKNFNNFILSQNIDVLKSLLKDGVTINVNDNYKRVEGNKEWIDPYTDKIILGKYSDGTPIRRYQDFIEGRTDIILNPLIESYNALNYFFTQEYMNSSVGAYYEHPNKKHKNLSMLDAEHKLAEQLADEKARKLALDKRNVDFTASMHAFLKNLIQGIPNEINVAIIPNSYDEYVTITGIKYDMAPDDGACYSNPFYLILQNNSLGGARVGLVKKTFTHFYDEKTGTAGIFKDAEFPLTNEWIRRSTRYLKMMRNMTDRIWRNPDGSEAIVDILKDYKGNVIELINPNCVRQGQLFFRNPMNGKYYAFWIKNGSKPNSYIRTIQEVDENGMAVSDMLDEEEKIINTNYDLWNLLGGEYSMEIRPENNKLTYSEASINTVVKIMNNTISLNGPKPSAIVETLEDLWQPLKHSDIHLMPTVGAVKMGIANINTEEAFELANPEAVNFFKIKTNQMGVQLDKEHHADGEDLSIMTQVLSACAARGYTQEQTLNLYNALAQLAKAGIRPYIDNFKLFFKISANENASPEQLEKARQKFENVLLDTLVKALANSTNTSATLLMVTQELLEKAKEGKEINFENLSIPLSDPAVMKKLHSTISVALTRAAIKIKIDGSLNMLCPSFGIVKVYNGKMKNNFVSDIDIINEQKTLDESPHFELINDISRIKLGRTYKLIPKYDEKHPILREIKHPQDYYNLRKEIGKYSSIREQFAPMTWEEVGQTSTPHPDDIISQIDSQRSIEGKINKAIELGLISKNDLEPRELDEQIISRIGGLSKADIAKEVWGAEAKDVKSELSKLLDIHKGGNKTINQLAEEIAGESLGTSWETDSSYVRNTIISALQSASTSNDILQYVQKARILEGIDNYINEYERELESLEDSKQVHTFEGGRELGAYNVTFTGTLNTVGLSPLIVTGSPATTAKKALSINGIDTLRHPDANGMHFGNPFTHLQSEVANNRAAVLVPTVREAVLNFEQWLKGEAFLDVEPERRQWIVNQINNGSLAGKPLVYYTHTIKDSEGSHYYNPETFPNHAQILLKYINLKAQEIAGPLFQLSLGIEKGFNLYDLKSVQRLSELRERNAPKQEIDEALQDLLSDLNILHSKLGEIETIDGIVTINPESVNIEPYEVVMPKIFATVFGLTTEDDLNTIKSDVNFFTKRLIKNLNTIPQVVNNNITYTMALLAINGKHIYVLNANDAVRSENFRPKEFQKIRENGKLYRVIDDDLVYELNENDLIWEYVDLDGNSTEIIVTDNVLDYLDRVDYATININTNNTDEYQEQLINDLRNSDKEPVKHYLEMVDYLIKYREGETLQNAIDDIQDISIVNYDDHPLAAYFTKLGKQIHSSFLKSLEIVAARIPAQSMLSFMPMVVVGFEGSDINTAYVSTTQILFQGSDYDIDAVSLAAYSFDRSGRYIIHSPLANIETLPLLKASLNIPFPTGIELEINDDEFFDYSQLIRLEKLSDLDKKLKEGTITESLYKYETNKPFYLTNDGKIIIVNNSVKAIDNLSKFIRECNSLGYIPQSLDLSLSVAINYIRGYINKHNNYINTSKNVELFSKNFIVTSMYDIGISPANLIESQAALDSITKPLKDVANATLKALESSIDNPANFTTNVHGFVLNMDGKQGVGICAVGLKGFFAATARYNEVLANGTPEEVQRLQSEVEIAGKKFRMLANAYTTNEVNQAILGEIITLLDLTNDAALVLSALLSLATDNAKELALSKLNAANMLGMYIYGIAIGMDFKDIANIISSRSGIAIDSLIKEDLFNSTRGLSMLNIFDYIELGPSITNTKKVPDSIKENYQRFLNKKVLRKLAWEGKIIVPGNKEKEFLTSGVIPKVDYSQIIKFLEDLKIKPLENEYYDGVIEYNNNIEKAQQYILTIQEITQDEAFIHGKLVYYNPTSNTGKEDSVYGNLKKLYEGGEEMRRLGLMLHINQGNETSYIKSLKFIDTVESAMSSRLYILYREYCRKQELAGQKRPDDYSSRYEFNFHDFIFDTAYREGVIDLYNGTCNEELFMIPENNSYRRIFTLTYIKDTNAPLEAQYSAVLDKLKRIPTSKVFFNILDVLLVPHYMEYLKSADMLHLYMTNSIKYRAIYNLGKRAITEIGAYSAADRENIFKRTELFIDRLIRDRFFFAQQLEFLIPLGSDYFVFENGDIKRTTANNSSTKIVLGTREGNASFKLLMEETIIPELQRIDKFKNNKFIQSLKPVLFSGNPEYLTTICYAPNINMSPRSDTDSALFEEIKHDFNELRTTDFTYPLGMIKADVINLLYYYNLIAFGGKIGENTLTNIFQDVLDYKDIKNHRDFESKMDKTGNFEISDKKNNIEGTISLDTLIREVAPKASSYSTSLNYFYEEDSKSGELLFKSKKSFDERFLENPFTGAQIDTGKFKGSAVKYTENDELKNYIVQSTDSDLMGISFTLKGDLKVNMILEKGKVTLIKVNGESIEIPAEDKAFFRNLKSIPKITAEGILMELDKDSIISKVDEIISCKI